MDRGLTTPHHEKQHVTKCYTGPQTWDGFIGTWNIRSLCRSGSLKAVSRKSAKYKSAKWFTSPTFPKTLQHNSETKQTICAQ
jgi:hypothetical protein